MSAWEPAIIRLDRIITRSGDDGTSALADGRRLPKQHALFELLGAIDEANAALGVARCEALPPAVAAALAGVQNDCFDLGADVACVGMAGREPQLTAAHLERLERFAAEHNRDLPPLTSFVLPAGTRAAATLHLARTVVRRAERAWCAAQATAEGAALDRLGQRWLNRLADCCFIWARGCNAGAGGDVQWVPGGG